MYNITEKFFKGFRYTYTIHDVDGINVYIASIEFPINGKIKVFKAMAKDEIKLVGVCKRIITKFKELSEGLSKHPDDNEILLLEDKARDVVDEVVESFGGLDEIKGEVANDKKYNEFEVFIPEDSDIVASNEIFIYYNNDFGFIHVGFNDNLEFISEESFGLLYSSNYKLVGVISSEEFQNQIKEYCDCISTQRSLCKSIIHSFKTEASTINNKISLDQDNMNSIIQDLISNADIPDYQKSQMTQYMQNVE